MTLWFDVVVGISVPVNLDILEGLFHPELLAR